MEELGRGRPDDRKLGGPPKCPSPTSPQGDGIPKAGLEEAGGREGRKKDKEQDRVGVTAAKGKQREELRKEQKRKEEPKRRKDGESGGKS